MMRKKVIVMVLTVLFEIIAHILLQRLGQCYPGFQPQFKTPGDGCDLANFIQRIGVLPYIFILFLGVFAYVFDQKGEKERRDV